MDDILDKKLKIGVVYLLYYHNESHVDDMVSAMRKISYPKECIELIIVSNLHDEKGSFVRYVDETVMPRSGKDLPRVTHLPQNENLGFAGGNNVGTQQALAYGCEYVFYHNNDGFVARDAFESLVSTMEADKSIGASQSLILLHPDTTLINSTGNVYHYLGFGYTSNYRVKLSDIQLPPVKDISYASGAALMVRASCIRQYGMWDHDFFLYHEDLEWSFRLRSVGYRVVLVRDSLFYHKYQFSRSIEKFYWMERNRYAVLLLFFTWPTLFLLSPMLLVLELGLWFFSWRGGWLEKNKAVYQYWKKAEHRALWLEKRHHIQSIRTVSDRSLLSYSVPRIEFQERTMRNPLLIYVGNPVMTVYYWLVVRFLIWW